MIIRMVDKLLTRDVISSILDDFTGMCIECQDRESFRNKLLKKKLEEARELSMLTPSEITKLKNDLYNSSDSDRKLKNSVTNLSKELKNHYVSLVKIFEELV